MNAREFFYLTARMRAAQRDYFETHDTRSLITAKTLERQVDDEIERVKAIVG